VCSTEQNNCPHYVEVLTKLKAGWKNNASPLESCRRNAALKIAIR